MNKVLIDRLEDTLKAVNLKGTLEYNSLGNEYNDDGDTVAPDVTISFLYSSVILSKEEREKFSIRNVAYRIQFITKEIVDNVKGATFIDDAQNSYKVHELELITNHRTKRVYKMIVERL